jgi:hypothetical protein
MDRASHNGYHRPRRIDCPAWFAFMAVGRFYFGRFIAALWLATYLLAVANDSSALRLIESGGRPNGELRDRHPKKAAQSRR